MNGEGCWSTVICTPEERATLGLTTASPWLLQCQLSAGHRGNHATDAGSGPRYGRRLWLEWNDFDDYAQSLIERNPCTVRSAQGAPCLFFEQHGGLHRYAPANGHTPSVTRGAGAPAGGAHTGPSRPAPHRAPVAPPGHADRLRMTTDSDIPAVRPAAAPLAQSASAAPAAGSAARSRHRLPDSDDVAVTPQSPDVAPAPPRAVPVPPPPAPRVTSGPATPGTGSIPAAQQPTDSAPNATPRSKPAPQTSSAPPRPDLESAISDVAAALERLVAALRGR